MSSVTHLTVAARAATPMDAAKSTLNKVDRIVSNAAVKGIETGGKAKEATGQFKS